MKLNYKLLALPIIVLLGLVYISFLFSSELENLKQKIDNVYFGNFIPVHKLHIIKSEYKNLINTPTKIVQSKTIILENWNYYNAQYKTAQEREVVKKVNRQVENSLKKQSTQIYDHMTKQIELLIQYEVSSATQERKEFLQKYEELKNYLFYNQIFIMVFIAAFIIFTIISTIKNHSKLEHLVNKYKSDSITDGLTGLYNRKYFDTILDEAIVVSGENDWETAFVMIDIDFFKQYNDTYGHDAGDIALKAVSKVLDTLFDKEYDYVFRLGGEEFGILVFDTNKIEISKRLEQLQNAIAVQKIKHSASKTGFLTLSMGVVLIDKSLKNMTRTNIYKLADKKLYQSKEYGRDQYTL